MIVEVLKFALPLSFILLFVFYKIGKYADMRREVEFRNKLENYYNELLMLNRILNMEAGYKVLPGIFGNPKTGMIGLNEKDTISTQGTRIILDIQTLKCETTNKEKFQAYTECIEIVRKYIKS